MDKHSADLGNASRGLQVEAKTERSGWQMVFGLLSGTEKSATFDVKDAS